jgi:hypothetical protein
MTRKQGQSGIGPLRDRRSCSIPDARFLRRTLPNAQPRSKCHQITIDSRLHTTAGSLILHVPLPGLAGFEVFPSGRIRVFGDTMRSCSSPGLAHCARLPSGALAAGCLPAFSCTSVSDVLAAVLIAIGLDITQCTVKKNDIPQSGVSTSTDVQELSDGTG